MVLVADDFEVSDDLENLVDTLAIAGRHDHRARNELYDLLAFKVSRFEGPVRKRFADVGEESTDGICFLTYCDLVLGWGGEGSFLRYFLGFYRWRLRHAVEREERRARRLVRWDEAMFSALALVFMDLAGVTDRVFGFGFIGC